MADPPSSTLNQQPGMPEAPQYSTALSLTHRPPESSSQQTYKPPPTADRAQDNCTGCIYPVCGATATCKLASPPTPTVAAPVTETLNPFTAVADPFTVSVSTVETLAAELASPA